MGIIAALKAIFTGSGAVKSIENIASEWITTDMESAEAKVLMVKALDPNGLMRRDLSNRVATLYSIYLITALILLTFEFFGFGNSLAIEEVTTKLTDLFLPISTLFGLIVSASFGVNYANVKGEK
tara:strand:+ start:941 stop:1315 length:375 start_codon:yes stop_codon:yes gene_type:complete